MHPVERILQVNLYQFIPVAFLHTNILKRLNVGCKKFVFALTDDTHINIFCSYVIKLLHTDSFIHISRIYPFNRMITHST